MFKNKRTHTVDDTHHDVTPVKMVHADGRDFGIRISNSATANNLS
jgi:hypothetical protein